MNAGAYRDYGYGSGESCWGFDYLMPSVLAMLGPPEGTILDMGCGNGAMASALIARGYDVYGVDASETGVAHANAAHPDRFFRMDFSQDRLPRELGAHRFTAVLSTEVIEHLYDPRRLLRLAHGILHPGGQLVISTPYHGYLKNVALALTGKMDGHFTALWDGGHIKFFSRATLKTMLRETGFEPTGFAGAGRIPWLWKSMVIQAVAREEAEAR